MESLQRLQGLYADLQAFTQTRIANIDRLSQELEDTIQEFRQLLDKPVPSAAEKTAYNEGKITVGSEDYGINEEFRHLSRAIGGALDLDELEAGKLLVQGSNNADNPEDYLVVDAIRNHHDHADLLLQSLRITLHEALNDESEDSTRALFRDAVAHILDIVSGPPSNGSAYLLKCLKAMEDLETRTAKVNEQIQTKAILSQARGSEFYATLDFQKNSLYKQHEALGAITALLFRGNYTISENLRKLHAVVKRWQRLDAYWIHYLPAFSAAFQQYGTPERNTSEQDAKSLNNLLTSATSESNILPVRPLLAILDLWWTVEYSAWFRDVGSRDGEDKKCLNIVTVALKDHALELLLFVCSSIHPGMWRHPSRNELIDLLLGGRNDIAMELDQPASTFFFVMLMESIELFTEAWITNLPDSIRKLKNEEDDARLIQLTAAQDGLLSTVERDNIGSLHLESLLVLMAFAFEDRPDAAESFWTDPDGNLYGFLQWASKRQTVPRVSAFCEMLCAISEGTKNAKSAHTFLLDESLPAASSRVRRVPTMNYQQIFAELELYAKRVHEKTSKSQMPRNASQSIPELNEPESPVMLSCYLRLLAHLCREHLQTRQYLTSSAAPDLPRTLLLLSSGPVPSYLRASIFEALEALLTDKDFATSDLMWKTIDDWVSSSHDTATMLQAKASPISTSNQSLASLLVSLTSISHSYDQYDAFLNILRALIDPVSTTVNDSQPLPFPPDLGSSYRNAGIVPYVDFVCGLLFVKRIRELADDGQAQLGFFHCLDFIARGLDGFKEKYVLVLDKTGSQQDGSMSQNPVEIYAQRHPFARLMQWLFSTEMSRMMLNMLHGRIDDVSSALSDSPTVLSLLRCIDVINLVLELQPTYFDIAKPMIRDSESFRSIGSSGVGSFEEIVIGHIEVIQDLCQFAATDHLELSLRSLALLQRLISSSKLNNFFGPSHKDKPRYLIDLVGQNVELTLQSVAAVFATKLQVDVRELEDGFESSGYSKKDGILAFLNAALGFDPDVPNISHLLLGFGRIGDRLTISPSIDNGTSLMNAIVDLVLEYPDSQDGGLLSWLIHLKCAGTRTLQYLWSSSVSSDLVLGQLRRFNFLSSSFISSTTVSQTTIWDNNTIASQGFWYSSSADALTEFLVQRSCLYDYAAKELASLSAETQSNLQRHAITTLQGKSMGPAGSLVSHLSVFDLFDFTDLDISTRMALPEVQFLADLDLDSFRDDATDTLPQLFDVAKVQALLELRRSQIITEASKTPGTKAIDPDDIDSELENLLAYVEAENRWTLAHKARAEALHHYVDMIVSIVECPSSEAASKAPFVLHVLQVILPKLDAYIVEEVPEALELARAVDSLLFNLAKGPPEHTQAQSRTDNVIAERLFQVFRICLEGIPQLGTTIELRTLLYSICAQYLTRITTVNQTNPTQYRRACGSSMDCVRSSSQRLVTILADDAEDGSDSCRLNALNLLSLLTALARSQQSNLVIDSLSKANFLEIMLEPIRNICTDFADTSVKHRAQLLVTTRARLSLLVQISLSQPGAIALLDAGLIQALRDSNIFRADPDLGLGSDLDTNPSSALTTSDPFSSMTYVPSYSLNQPQSSGASVNNTTTSSLVNYFTLLASTLRLLVSTFVSRSPSHEGTAITIRQFLSDHRGNMVGVFKKAAGVSGAGVVIDSSGGPSFTAMTSKFESQAMKDAVDECVRCYTGLVVGCGFIDFEEESTVGDGYGSGSGAVSGRGYGGGFS